MPKFASLFLIALFFIGCMSACSDDNTPISDVTIYTANAVVTPADNMKSIQTYNAVAVRDETVVGVGDVAVLQAKFAGARLDNSFVDKTIVPGFIDPHVHMILGAVMYAKPFAPPWDVQTPAGLVKGLPDRASFLKGIAQINAANAGTEPLVIYGYHNLVHGDLDKHDLDAITTKRPLIIWHYSGHDYYLNSNALKFAKVKASWADDFHGVPLGADGEPTGRIYEDALQNLFANIGYLFLGPADVSRGYNGQADLFASNGVTAVAEMGYGIFGLELEDNYYKALQEVSPRTKIYLVPEHRAFAAQRSGKEISTMKQMVGDTQGTWPRVLPQVKLFTDAAFYSQTMRVSPPGYTGGQNKGEEGLWVTGPDKLTDVMRPYWNAGLDIHIHSNGDAAQDVTLDALDNVKKDGTADGQRLIIEHGGLITPSQIHRGGELGIGLSVASHYVHYMGKMYEEAIGDRVKYMTPLASALKADIPTTMHSDAPLAPPSPLTAASVHILRSTREGGVSTPSERLTRAQAFRAITINAAWSLGLENEIGSIAVGKKADFTILAQNPLETKAEDWPQIGIWGVVLDGKKKPLSAQLRQK